MVLDHARQKQREGGVVTLVLVNGVCLSADDFLYTNAVAVSTTQHAVQQFSVNGDFDPDSDDFSAEISLSRRL